jgi:hypothetical protein
MACWRKTWLKSGHPCIDLDQEAAMSACRATAARDGRMISPPDIGQPAIEKFCGETISRDI